MARKLGSHRRHEPTQHGGEWVAIQTGRGLVYRTFQGRMIQRNFSTRDAARQIHQLCARLVFVDLLGNQLPGATDQSPGLPKMRENSFHYFIHTRTAKVHGAQSIVTLNLTDYARMTKLPLEIPARECEGFLQGGAGLLV